MHGWGSRDTLYPLYVPRTWGWGGTGLKPPKNLLNLKDHLLAKFHQDPSSGLDFYWKHTYTLPPAPPWGAQIKKQKNTRLLKFDYREILFYKYCTILKKNFTPSRSPPWHPQLLILALNQKSSCTILFASSNAFQNDMTWSGNAKNHGGDRFQGKGLDAGQGLPCSDWEGVLPTQVVLNSNLVTSENFIQFCPSIQKLFMVFFNTDGQTHRRMDTQTPYKTNHPTTLYGYWRKFF